MTEIFVKITTAKCCQLFFAKKFHKVTYIFLETNFTGGKEVIITLSLRQRQLAWKGFYKCYYYYYYYYYYHYCYYQKNAPFS